MLERRLYNYFSIFFSEQMKSRIGWNDFRGIGFFFNYVYDTFENDE